MTASGDDSDTFADPYGDTPLPLGKGITVRFGGDDRDATFDVGIEDGELVIRANMIRRADMVFKPKADNAIRVAIVPRQRS